MTTPILLRAWFSVSWMEEEGMAADLPSELPQRRPAIIKRRRKRPVARATHQFFGQTEDELSFSPGETIHLLKRVDDNWLEGELDGRIGIFPKNRVRIDVENSSLTLHAGRTYAVVLNDFPGDCPGDLPLIQGQIIELRSDIGSGWSQGILDDNTGIFPTSFVVPLVDLPSIEEQVIKDEVDGVQVINGQVNELQVIEEQVNDVHKPVPKPRTTRPVPKPRNRGRGGGGGGATTLPRSFKQSVNSSSTNVSLSNGTDYEEQLAALNLSLEAEEKMKLSAQRLLKVCQNEEKKDKLGRTLQMHQNKIDEINEEIQLLESKQYDIPQGIKSAPATPPTTPPTLHIQAAKPDEGMSQGERVFEELLNTERDYLKELSAFCMKVLPSFKQWDGIVWSELFSNIEELIQVSDQLIKSLEGDDECSVDVGLIFKEIAPEIREKYGTYCRNHEHASQLLEKLCEDKETATKIKSLMVLGRPEVTSWDLHTLLIKPVQRVLKYPLLLGKLLEHTPDSDPKRKTLSESFKLSSQVALDINEIKRRKDLLERYTGAGRDEKRITFGTMRKKVRRFRQTLTQKTGLRSATVDGVYTAKENVVLSLEATLRTLINDINAFIEEGESFIEHCESLTDSMNEFVIQSSVMTEEKKTFSEMKKKWKNHVKIIRDEVLSPLSILLGLFNDPLLLMNKRGDKLLDYDSLQYDLEKCTEPDKLQQLKEDVTLAKRTYEALNTQLIEDLPLFSDKVTLALKTIILCYLEKELSFHEGVSAILSSQKRKVEEKEMSLSGESIIKCHRESLQDMFECLCTLSIIPSSLPLSFGIIVTSNRSPQLLSRSDNVPLRKAVKGIRKISAPNSFLSRKRRSQSPIYEEITDDIKSNLIQKSQSIDVLSSRYEEDDEAPPIENDEDETTPTRNESPDYELPPDAFMVSPDNTSVTLSHQELSPTPSHSPLPPDTQLLVVYDFDAESDIEVSVKAGQLVTLLCPYDSDGCEEWWLVSVQSTGETGYVPFNFFEMPSNYT